MKITRRAVATAALLSLGLAGPLAFAPARAQTPAAAERWDLRDLYPDIAAWTQALARTREAANALEALKDGATRDGAALRAALDAISQVQAHVVRLGSHAGLAGDEDLREPRAQERRQQAEALWPLVGEKTAWLAPALQAVPRATLEAWLAADPVLKARHDLFVDDTLRSAPHTLSPEGERLLAAAGTVLQQPFSVYRQLADAELPRPTVTLSNGRRVKLNTPAYETERTSRVRADRQRVFDAYWSSWKAAEGTVGATLAATVMGNVYRAQSRRHAGALEAALFGANMPRAVYDQLVAQANAGLPVLHRYLRLRAKLLGVKDLAYFDSYPPLVPAPKGLRFDLAASREITLAALAPLGDEYLGVLRRGFAARWSDTHPRPGKVSGAYVRNGGHDVHPYVLLNHQDDFSSLSTFAHEWGHAVHTVLANANQPFEKAWYSTFIAESASIGNEMLLSDHLIANAKTRDEKRFHAAQALESIRTTFFRQVMFAEFERAMHEEVQAGRPLSGARLSDLYCGLLKRYHGHDQGVMRIDPAYCVEWAFVPHFHFDFYVWQYATSMVGAAEFTQAIQREGTPARDRFINLLKAGGSDYAYPLYVKAGVDLAQPGPYRALLARMDRLIDELESLSR